MGSQFDIKQLLPDPKLGSTALKTGQICLLIHTKTPLKSNSAFFVAHTFDSRASFDPTQSPPGTPMPPSASPAVVTPSRGEAPMEQPMPLTATPQTTLLISSLKDMIQAAPAR